MNDVALARRRRRRRVPEAQRKRASRACDRCKSRKSKCIETTAGICQRCQQKRLSCRFDKEITPPGESNQNLATTPPSIEHVNSSKDSPEEQITINSHQTERTVWPRFLSRLREAFTLDVESPAETQDIVDMQERLNGPRFLQPWDLRRLQKAVDTFPPRPVADFLLYVCIHRGTDIFFFFDQAQLLARIDEFYTDPQSPLRTDVGFISLALAAFALGSQFTSLEKPDESQTISPGEDGDPCTIFHRELRILIPDLIEMPSLYSIQVLFLVGVYLMPLSALSSSYVYLGLALRKALEFDLHQYADDPNLSEREKEVRHRTWWTIYALERVTTVKLNRPRAIEVSIITVPLPKSFPAMDAEQENNNVVQQAANAKLALILDRIAEIGNCTTQRARIELHNQAEADLKEWKRSLPPHFKVFRISPKDPSYRGVFHLYLNYYYAWIAMGKASVVTVVRSYLRQRLGGNSNGNSNSEAENSNQDQSLGILSSSCIRAARKMLRLFESIANTGNMTRFSFTDFQGCSIATIVTILAGILERNSDYEALVGFGLSCLRKMSIGIVTAQIGVRFVEALQTIADEAVAKLFAAGQSPQQPQSVGTPGTAADYNRWAQWLSQVNQQPRDVSTSPTLRPESSATSRLPDSLSMSAAASDRNNAWEPAETVLSEIPSVATGFTTGNLLHDFHTGEGLFPLAAFGDDQTFLMGLTGMDVLDFGQL